MLLLLFLKRLIPKIDPNQCSTFVDLPRTDLQTGASSDEPRQLNLVVSGGQELESLFSQCIGHLFEWRKILLLLLILILGSALSILIALLDEVILSTSILGTGVIVQVVPGETQALEYGDVIAIDEGTIEKAVGVLLDTGEAHLLAAVLDYTSPQLIAALVRRKAEDPRVVLEPLEDIAVS